MTQAQTRTWTKSAFLAELQRKLKGMPDVEVTNALAYCDEYLSDAGPENEAAVIAELGSPSEVAAGIMGDFVYADTTGEDKSTKKGLTALWYVVIGILAAPIAFIPAVILIVLIFSLLTTILSFIFSFFVAAAALVFAGIVFLGVGFVTLFTSFASGLTTIGAGLISLAVGVAMSVVLIWATKHAVNGVALLGSKLLRKWRHRDGQTPPRSKYQGYAHAPVTSASATTTSASLAPQPAPSVSGVPGGPTSNKRDGVA